MGAVAPILLQFVVAHRPRAWCVCRPCALARARPPVAAPAGAGARGCGGARRAGSTASPPGRRGRFGGRGGVPSASGGMEGRRPRGPQVGGGSRGEREGGAAPWFPTPLPWEGGLWPPAQSPFFAGAPPRVICVQSGLLGSPGRRGRPGWPSVGQPGGGGRVRVRRNPGGSPGGLCRVVGGEVT